MMRRVLLIHCVASALAAVAGMAPTGAAAGPAPATVVWFSIDGIRSDYLDRADTPNLDALIAEGVSTRQLQPVFPSLTFPSHVSMATGAKVAEHGIPLNVFYDRGRERLYAYPPWGFMLQAEPIWLTAQRQGVRTAVLDWPLSHDQRGDVRTAYFDDRFERGPSDGERLERALEIFDQDPDREAAEPPLRLIMAYMVGPDTLGHAHGPDSEEVIVEMERVDERVGQLVERITARFDGRNAAGTGDSDGQLYLILTTDHGMAAVETLVHLGHLADVEDDESVRQVTGGNVGHLFFQMDDDADREAAIERALATLGGRAFATAYRQADLPEKWGYKHPDRVGDVVVILDNHHTFSRRIDTATAAVDDRGPLGMHGYDPRREPDMFGPAIFWRYPDPLAAADLGPIHALQLHATVAALLGVAPAEGARAEPIELDPAGQPQP